MKLQKYFLFAGCFTLLSSFSTVAHCAEGIYFSGQLGLSAQSNSNVTDPRLPTGVVPDVKFDNGLGIGAALGYDFGTIRLELELIHRKNKIKSVSVTGLGSTSSNGDSSSLASMVNVYYDVENSTILTPFVMAGLGYAKVKLNNLHVIAPTLAAVRINSSYKDNVAAYQFGAGVSMELSENISLSVAYRYFKTADPKTGTTTTKYASHNGFTALRLHF